MIGAHSAPATNDPGKGIVYKSSASVTGSNSKQPEAFAVSREYSRFFGAQPSRDIAAKRKCASRRSELALGRSKARHLPAGGWFESDRVSAD